MRNFNLSIDEQAFGCVDELPRKMSASKIFRYVVKAIILKDEAWFTYLENDVDAKVIRGYLKKTLVNRLINPDEK